MLNGVMFRKSAMTLGVVAMFGAASARAEESVNVSKLNKALGKIVREVLQSHQQQPNALFKAIDFKIDEKATILDNDDKFATKINLKATAARARWSAEETSLGVDLGMSADRVKQEATLEIAGSLETDTLGLVHFAATELKTDACRPNKTATKFDAAYCTAMKNLSVSKSVDEVIKTIVALGPLAVDEATDRLAQAEKELAAAPDNQKANLQARVGYAKEDLKQATAIAAELKRGGEAGSANGTLRVSFQGYDAKPYGEVRDIEVYLDKGRLDVKLKFTMSNIKDIDSYFKMKPMVLDTLKKFESGSKDEIDEAKRFLELYLNIAGSLIEGK